MASAVDGGRSYDRIIRVIHITLHFIIYNFILIVEFYECIWSFVIHKVSYRVNCLQLSLQQIFQKIASGYDNCKVLMITAVYSYY